ncbi:MAG TPA: helix-turn-helix domain-containing protein [Trinickia sp.]|uniref:helix-turn-helix domain-containing protein n=1 Tax=Trinickia sp. TaxID=2571163 RepID=UPI002B777B51|nr:helix-turn-helix domain-containing protein [Trinickia sp.]HTI16711.1 helix-turn-helix domain-containing protein [Trinickia sp.]
MTHDATSMDSPAVAERVRALMSRHGIAKRQQTTELCNILELSFSQGHRKLRGSSPWTLAQIQRVAAAFNEPAAQLIGVMPDDLGVAYATAREALLCVGALQWPCVAWIGEPVNAHRYAEFVAYPRRNEWHVVRLESGAPVPTPDSCEVLKIEIRPQPQQHRRPVVAIVDSDRTATEALRHYLEQSGFSAVVHDTLRTFEDAMRSQTFDAVITDWLFGEHTAAAAIEAVRRSPKPDAPVFLLTGELLTGKASESEISDVILRLDVSCYEKPARLAILTADLSKRLGLA